MKKGSKKGTPNAVAEMQAEYDLQGKKGIRNKYAAAMRRGYSVRVLNADGTITVTKYPPFDDTITLDPDVRPYFPDSVTVNETLRALIALIPATALPAKTRRGRTRNGNGKSKK